VLRARAAAQRACVLRVAPRRAPPPRVHARQPRARDDTARVRFKRSVVIMADAALTIYAKKARALRQQLQQSTTRARRAAARVRSRLVQRTRENVRLFVVVSLTRAPAAPRARLWTWSRH
jgi:hypothetical protein